MKEALIEGLHINHRLACQRLKYRLLRSMHWAWFSATTTPICNLKSAELTEIDISAFA